MPHVDTDGHEILHGDARRAITKPKKRKRRESFGAIRELPSGRLQASYTGPDGNRHNAPQTFDTATDARGWLARQRIAIEDGKWGKQQHDRKHAGRTLEQYSREWMNTRVNRHGEHLRPRTRVEYERLLSGPLEPLTGVALKALTPDVVRGWYSTHIATGKQTQTARAYSLLKSILATAVQDELISSNPCMIRGAANASTGKKVTPPTSAELQKIVDAIAPRFKAAVILAAWAALRYGELTELRRKDLRALKLEDGSQSVVVTIDRAVTHTTGHGYVIGSTKSAAGVRVVALPPHVNDVILEHLKQHTGRDPESLLFPGNDGVSHLAESSFVRYWYPARKAAKRPDLPFHALRHYGATKFAQTGATLKEIQERLGHSTVAAAMKYQHAVGRDAELARRMSELEVT